MRIKEEDADALGVRGGWKTWDFAPDSRGGAVSRLAVWKLNAPGIAEGEFAIFVLIQISTAGQDLVVLHVFVSDDDDDLEMFRARRVGARRAGKQTKAEADRTRLWKLFQAIRAIMDVAAIARKMRRQGMTLEGLW